MTDLLTREQVERALPANLKQAATQSLTDMLNQIAQDPLVAEQVRNNFISYTAVLREGRFKTEDYLHAVAYVSYKLMGYNNQDSYFRTFPQRHADLLAKGATAKDISAYVSAYSKGKLVNMIMEQAAVPTWVLNQDLFQKALNTQADLMQNATSEKVRSDAANSILTHLGKPKDGGLQINLDLKESSGMSEMKEMLARMAQQQQDLIAQGYTTKQIAAQPLIEGSAREVKNGVD